MKRLLPLLAALAWLAAADVRAGDWHDWRGPSQTGYSPETGLPDHWSPDPQAPNNNLLWKAPFGGRTTPIVMNNRVYLINAVGEDLTQQERVMCFDADTGKVLWQHPFNVWHTDIVAVRLGWTNMCGDPETGNVYAHGTQGLFFCFDKDGKVVWSRSLNEEYGRISGYGGRVTSPVVEGDLVILGMLNSSWGEYARGGTRFVAFDKKTGDVVWWTETGLPPKDTYYSVPVVATIDGVRTLISGGGDGGVHAFQVHTGKKLWSYVFGTGAVNCSPVVDGNMVYIGQGEENTDNNRQGRMICLDASQVTNGKPKLVWDRPGLKIKYCSPIIHEGRLYVCDEVAQMYCLDAKTGNTIWRYKYGRNSKGSPVLADGKIYIGEVNAKFHILKPGDKNCKELHSQFFPSPDGTSDVEINGSAAVANGRVYFMTRDELFCLAKNGGQKTETAAAGEGTKSPPKEEKTDGEGGKAAWLQVVPADVVLSPGESASFKARVYDERGNFLRETKADWSVGPFLAPPPIPGQKQLPGPPPPPLKAEVADDGKLTVAKEVPGQFGGVIAKAEGLTARARVRVAPLLPYKQDFAKIPENRSPGGWVNTQGKFGVVEIDGHKALKKLATNASPLVARANAFIGMPTLTDYTIQCDVMGAKKGADMPDVGVVNNRYTLMLDGNKQRLRLYTWDALPRIDKGQDFQWKPGEWYTLKLTVEVKGDKAVARGKIWPQGHKEPEAWALEVEDPVANREGSPALYGYATGIIENKEGAAAFYQNVVITPNRPRESADRRTSQRSAR